MDVSTQGAGARDDYPGFRVAGWLDRFGSFVSRWPGLWIRLGNLETRLLSDEIAGIAIEAPIYVGGLARSGSTILLECLARHPDTATHRYRDYPALPTPWFWNRFLDRMPAPSATATERAHADGLMVTPDSPEALEEMLWMAFFPESHEPGRSNVIGPDGSRAEFEAFYRDHIRKLLLIRGGRRYLAKGNYNILRFDYLLNLFPDARFVIPVREPVWHIASLMKQHALFCAGERRHPRALRYMQRVGHFEFGLDRRPLDFGDPDATAEILDCWQRGAEVEGWARYWAQVHRFLAERLADSAPLRAASLVVRFEDLCRDPKGWLEKMFAHCRLPAEADLRDSLAATIRFPGYYRPAFDDRDLRTIERETAEAARLFGYG